MKFTANVDSSMHFDFDELFVARNKGVIDTAHHFSRCVD